MTKDTMTEKRRFDVDVSTIGNFFSEELKHVASTSSKITEVMVLKITGSRSNLPPFSQYRTFFIHLR